MTIEDAKNALPKVELVHNWRDVFKYAWSVRLLALAAVLSGLEVALSAMSAYGVKPSFIPSGLLAAFSGLVTVAAFVARFIAQKKLGAQ
jgi:hypothetical protein